MRIFGQTSFHQRPSRASAKPVGQGFSPDCERSEQRGTPFDSGRSRPSGLHMRACRITALAAGRRLILSRRDVILIISRMIALYFIYCAIITALAIPYQLFISHLISLASPGDAAPISIAEKVKLSRTVYDLVYLIAVCILARFFYKCGPRVQRYFLPDNSIESEAGNTKLESGN